MPSMVALLPVVSVHLAARLLSHRLRIRRFDLAHRHHLDLRIALVRLDCAGDADHFALKCDGPAVTRQFRSSRDV